MKKDLVEESIEIKEILAGNKDKYFQIIDCYKDKLFAVAFQMSASEAEAEKLIEKGFIEVYQNLEKYNDSVFFSDWLYEQFIPIIGVKRADESARHAKLPFHNPHYIEMEEALHSLAPEAKFQFLLIKLLDTAPVRLSELIGKSKEEIEENYSNSLNQIRRSTLSNDIKNEGDDCHSEEELSLYFDEKVSDEKEQKMNDHLEFCPDCREVLHFLKQEESTLEKVLEYPKLNESFNEKVLRKLDPYVPAKPKHRTWKYQLSAVGILGAIFLFSVVILPTLKPLASMVSTYMEHGTIYNVWTEGTYAITDEEITLEITKVEIDSVFMAVYYEISREGKKPPKTFPFEEVDFYNYNPLKIVDEEGKQYPIEATFPDHLRYERHDKEEGQGKERPYYLVKMPEDLPDQFNLEIKFAKLQGQLGKWNLEIPIRYDKVEDTAVTVNLNKKMNIDDKAVVEIMDATFSEIGSRIRYKVNHTEEEKARLRKLLKEHDQEYRMEEILQGRHVGLHVTTEEEHLVLPIYFNYMDPYNPNKPIELYFSNYYLGNEEQIQMGGHQIEGKIENPKEELYIKMLGASFQEPTFFSMEVPLEETETTPLEGNISNYKLLDYSLTPVKDGEGNITKYALIINGENQQKGASGDIGWELSDQTGNYIPTEGWYHYEDMQKEGPKKLLHVDIVTHNTEDEFPETLVIKADYIYSHYDESTWEKLSLFDKGEKNDSESE
ncbi:sigma factor [Sutcliffiella horikoshii]|uniref:sigma factor n=1 Tax=Sutcliffiella horikoshii TaxID=79883 RepID=UPI001CFD48E1|nr:sigma factor [Sutcliffiella horikoshii]